jgi:hypothetical protein
MRPEVLLNWGRFALVLVAIVGSLLLIFAPWQPPQERPCTIREIRLGARSVRRRHPHIRSSNSSGYIP